MKQKDEVAKMKEINYKAISNKIRRKRVSMGLTQEYLATAADVNVSHISNIENCHSKVSLNTLVYICKAMNTTLDYVVSEEYSSDNESLDQQKIFEHVKEEAKKMGCYEVTLNVWEGNDTARRFYEKMGMVPKETQMEFILK